MQEASQNSSWLISFLSHRALDRILTIWCVIIFQQYLDCASEQLLFHTQLRTTPSKTSTRQTASILVVPDTRSRVLRGNDTPVQFTTIHLYSLTSQKISLWSYTGDTSRSSMRSSAETIWSQSSSNSCLNRTSKLSASPQKHFLEHLGDD